MENRLLFAGLLGNYDPREERLRVKLRIGFDTPQGMVYGTRIKLRIRPPHQFDQVFVMYARILRCRHDFWFVIPERLAQYTESRSSFRVSVRGSALVRDAQAPEDECMSAKLIDVSLGGICFQSRADFAVQQDVLLTNVRLMPDRKGFTLPCRIVRIAGRGVVYTRYGCRFLEMSERQQNLLFRDLLALQAKTLHR